MRVNGRVKGVERSELGNDQKDEVLQDLLLHVDESYIHCRRSLKFSNLWDADNVFTKIASRRCRPKSPESNQPFSPHAAPALGAKKLLLHDRDSPVLLSPRIRRKLLSFDEGIRNAAPNLY